jgi:hypothetical protein
MSKNKKTAEPTIADVERFTFEAMRHCGMIPPMTIEEVAAVESELDSVELPFAESNPFELLKKLDVNDADLVSGPASFDAVAADFTRNLARAAREGGEISSDVGHRMAEDKARHQHYDNVNQ